MTARGRWRTINFGLRTVLGLSEAGFFIPHRHAGLAKLAEHERYDTLVPAFESRLPELRAFLAAIDGFADDLAAIGGAPPPEPRFEQDWFPRLDAAALYTLVRTERPARILEIGSGHSTRFLARAVRDGGLSTQIAAIDPRPRADISKLPVALDLRALQEAGGAVGKELAAGDLLMCDSSHVLMPGTDVDIVLNRIMPGLPSGVFVGFHDIFLPAPYPAAWPFTSYNEQLGVAALLQGGYDLVFSSAYVLEALADEVQRTVIGRLPIQEGARESLILLRKR
ncbi:hypothetical protein AB7M35_002484 [Amorphus suaedae]